MKKIQIICVIAVVLLGGMTGILQADDWDMDITVDNQYDIYFGTNMTTDFYAGGDTSWYVDENYTATGRASTDYLYVATASDHSSAQGFLGTFTNTTTNVSISTGDLVWEVFPAGAHLQNIDASWPSVWPASQMPTQSEVDAAIAYAETNNLWVAPTVSPGYDNDVTTPIAPYTWEWGYYYTNIDTSASWIWYDSGKDIVPSTFAPAPIKGFNHDEFLVFRVAGAVPEPATMSLVGLGALGLFRRKHS